MAAGLSCVRALLGSVVGVIALLCLWASPARAQATVDEKGSLSAGLDYSFGASTKVITAPDGATLPDSPTQTHTIQLDLDYVPIERLGLSVQAPFMIIKYTGDVSHVPFAGGWDDGDTHATWQDFRANVRYQLVREIVMFTPHVGVTVPLHDYETNGFAAVGRHLKQVHLGASLARTLDPVLPDLYFHITGEYTISQRFDEEAPAPFDSDACPASSSETSCGTKDLNLNRTDLAVQLGYFLLDDDLELNVAANWRWSQDGVDFTNFADYSPVQQAWHDVLLNEDFFYLGGGVNYDVTDMVRVGAYARFFLRGFNTRDQNLFGLNVEWKIL